MRLTITGAVGFVMLWMMLGSCKSVENPYPVKVEEVVKDSCLSYADTTLIISNDDADVPVFSVKPGPVPFGSIVYISSDSTHKDYGIEVSLDSGATWQPKKCISITADTPLWARYVSGSQHVRTVAKGTYTVFYQRVLVIGNSITIHGPLPDKGWTGNWGMAASAPEKDYVHLITARLKLLNPNVQILLRHDAEFEQTYTKYDFKKLVAVSDFKPDMVVMRIAENTDLNYVYAYREAYARYIQAVTAQSFAKVICTNSFWGGFTTVDDIIKNLAAEKGYLLSDISALRKDKSYSAIDLFSNAEVGSHPSDKGMKAIADAIIANF